MKHFASFEGPWGFLHCAVRRRFFSPMFWFLMFSVLKNVFRVLRVAYLIFDTVRLRVFSIIMKKTLIHFSDFFFSTGF